jgi:hypothetical protein
VSIDVICQQPVYVITHNGLYSVNVDAFSVSLIGNTELPMVGDIAVTPDGRLWGAYFDTLYQINPANASIQRIGGMGISGNSLVDLNDSLLLSEYSDSLFSVNVNNASHNCLGAIGFTSQGDLTWYEHDLYLSAINGMLVRIKLNDSYSAIISSEVVDFIPPLTGVITYPEIGSPDKIIGFDGNEMFKLCPFGGYEYIGNIPVGASGAATRRLPFQDPAPTSCELILFQNENNREICSLSPNPVSNNGTVSLHMGNNLSGNLLVTVISTQGNSVSSGNVSMTNGKAHFKLNESIESGIYICEIISDKIHVFNKLIIL